MVNAKIEIKNLNRLINDCHKTENNTQIRKTKTAHIVDTIQERTYTRGPSPEILQCNKQETKTLIIARFGMLECGKNFKGTLNELCSTCNEFDNENRRLNDCPLYKNVNLFNTHCKVNFMNIFSTDVNTFKPVIKLIEKVWNVQTAHGSMNK